MESLSLSHSVVNNLNQAFDDHAKINRHLQTGKRVMDARDDVGEASKLSKIKMDLVKKPKDSGKPAELTLFATGTGWNVQSNR